MLMRLSNAPLPDFLALILLGVLFAFTDTAFAQTEHDKHHPDDATLNIQFGSQVATGMGPGIGPGQKKGPGMMGGGMDMEKMRLGMQGALPTPTDLYPTLMSLPKLNPEEREQVLQQARQRMREGMALINTNLGLMANATEKDDFAAMQAATYELHQGLARFDSGLAVQQALAEGREPRSIALDWFKTELNLSPTTAVQASVPLSFFHWFVMGLLLAFVVLVLVVHLLKMRHATKLLQHLAETDSANMPDEPAVPVVPAPKWNGRLQVIRIFQETPDVKTFRLVNADGGPVPFTYEPGQFLSMRMNVDGEMIKRTYTIASSPTQRYHCELTIKREELGIMSRFMHERVNEGDLIEADKPGGKFTFDGSEAESIVLIGGGVGITPLMAVLRYLADAGWKKPIYFLFACKTLDDFIFRRELEYLDARNDNVHLHCFISALEESASASYAEQGRISAERLAALVPDIQSRRVYLCGSPPMMDAVKAMLAELNVPKAQLKTEAFGTGKPKQTVSLESSVESDPKVTFQKSQKTAPFPECCTLLDVAENIGVEIESSCLMGTCGICMTKLISGEVTMESEDGLDDNDRAAGMILACQAKAKTDVVVDA